MIPTFFRVGAVDITKRLYYYSDHSNDNGLMDRFLSLEKEKYRLLETLELMPIMHFNTRIQWFMTEIDLLHQAILTRSALFEKRFQQDSVPPEVQKELNDGLIRLKASLSEMQCSFGMLADSMVPIYDLSDQRSLFDSRDSKTFERTLASLWTKDAPYSVFETHRRLKALTEQSRSQHLPGYLQMVTGNVDSEAKTATMSVLNGGQGRKGSQP